MLEGFTDVCIECGEEHAELYRVHGGQLYFRCLCRKEYRQPASMYNVGKLALALEWLANKRDFPVGRHVNVFISDHWHDAEVVGHKPQVFRTLRPGINVRVKGYGTLPLDRRELLAWNG